MHDAGTDPLTLPDDTGAAARTAHVEHVGTALLTTRSGSTSEQREKFVREWYREVLKAEIARLLPLWEERTGLKATGWQTKCMKTRWGSCNTKTGKIWLSVQLAQKAPACLEYVIVHELVHLAEKGHGKRFKSLMDRYLPLWREIRATMNN
jgi:predicted metal-dependent hydrolase